MSTCWDSDFNLEFMVDILLFELFHASVLHIMASNLHIAREALLGLH